MLKSSLNENESMYVIIIVKIILFFNTKSFETSVILGFTCFQ